MEGSVERLALRAIERRQIRNRCGPVGLTLDANAGFQNSAATLDAIGWRELRCGSAAALIMVATPHLTFGVRGVVKILPATM